MRTNYGDSAIGYVQVMRKVPLCFCEAKIVPEHRVRTKKYAVRVIVDEEKEVVVSADCLDCTASLGISKFYL